ncbi:MAG: ABC transporter permease [Fibrobacter sp.]|nr:ABC transporter permease [Fibrobacter sp.]
MIRRIVAIIIKEFRHIMRDWQTLMIILLMPVLMMFLYGYALTMDLVEVPVIIVDPAMSDEVRTISGGIDATTLFNVIGIERRSDDPVALLKKHHAKLLVRFGPAFAKDLRSESGGADVQVLIDGADANTGTILRNAIGPMITKAALDILKLDMPKAITVHPRVLYNPQQRSALYFVPGLMAIILLMISAMLTSLTITREKELGTLEQLFVSPLKPREIIIGKILPYLLIAAIDGVLIMIVGRYFFGITIAGNAVLLAGASAIYIFTSLAMGLFISTAASNQQSAMMIVLPVTMLPTIILSGFIFPISSMPAVLQYITYVVPATYFLEIIRGIVLKGVGFAILMKPIVVLLAIGLLLVIVSIKRFRVKL